MLFSPSVRWLALGSLLLSTAALADQAPDCLAYGRPLPVNNAQILHWKRTTPNQFRERGHVTGKVSQIFNDKNGHDHFEIQIGRYQEDTLEVIYNQDFGSVPTPKVGDDVEACGDFIVSTAPSGPYPASPSGAIIHWVHKNPSGRGHDSGFLMINGTLYGQDAEHAGPPPNYPGRRGRGNGRGGDSFDANAFEDSSAFPAESLATDAELAY